MRMMTTTLITTMMTMERTKIYNKKNIHTYTTSVFLEFPGQEEFFELAWGYLQLEFQAHGGEQGIPDV